MQKQKDKMINSKTNKRGRRSEMKNSELYRNVGYRYLQYLEVSTLFCVFLRVNFFRALHFKELKVN